MKQCRFVVKLRKQGSMSVNHRFRRIRQSADIARAICQVLMLYISVLALVAIGCKYVEPVIVDYVHEVSPTQRQIWLPD